MNDPQVLRLVDSAGFIFRGRVLRQVPAGPGLPTAAAGKTVAVVIDEIFRSTDALRGLVGREVTLVADQAAAMAVGTELLLFTNCVAVGSQVVVREVGHMEWSGDAAREAAQTSGDRPLQRRVEAADLIVMGRVISCGAVSMDPLPKSEHDPDWWIARVQVQSVIKGQSSANEIDVLYANSTDIAWYNAPKLGPGARGIYMLQHMTAKQAPAEVARPIYQITDPLDALLAERLPEVRRACDRIKGGQ